MTSVSRSRLHALRRHGAAIADQGISSGTNFLAVLAMARGLDARDFGVFAMAYTALTLFLGVSRSFFGIPVALASADTATDKLHRLYSESMSALAITFVPITICVMLVGAVAATNGSWSIVWLIAAVGLSTPLVMMQDLSRYYAISQGVPRIAVLSDLVWLVGVVVLLIEGPNLGVVALSLWWAAMIALSLLLALPGLRPSARFRGGLTLLRPRRGLRESVSVTVLLSTGVTLVMGFLMVPFIGATAVGTIRGAGTLFGPINTLIALLDFSVLGSLAKRSRSRDFGSVYLVTLALTVVSVAWAAVLLILPASVGRVLLGQSWAATRGILPITSVEYVLLCVAAGIAVLFKLRNRPRPLLVNRLVASIVIVASSFVFLLSGGGVIWMAVALLLGAAVNAAGMIISSLNERRHTLPQSAPAPIDPGSGS